MEGPCIFCQVALRKRVISRAAVLKSLANKPVGFLWPHLGGMRFCSNWMFPWVSWRKFLQIRNTCSAFAEVCWVPPCPWVSTGSWLRVLSGALAWRNDHNVQGQRPTGLSPSLWPFSFCRTPPPQSHFVYFILVCFVFWGSILLNSPGWPGTFSPPASASPVHPWLSKASLNRSHNFPITFASTRDLQIPAACCVLKEWWNPESLPARNGSIRPLTSFLIFLLGPFLLLELKSYVTIVYFTYISKLFQLVYYYCLDLFSHYVSQPWISWSKFQTVL